MLTRNTSRLLNPVALFFVMMSLALGTAAWAGSSLAWDGSFQLLEALNSQSPYVPHHRYIVVFVQSVVIYLSRFASDLRLLSVAFGLAYGALVLLALYASWWITRGDGDRGLFYWAAMSFAIGVLPGQFPVYSEATLAVQFFWPLLLCILTGSKPSTLPILGVSIALLLITHPTSVVLLFIAACAAFAVGLARKEIRRRSWFLSAVLILLSIAYALVFSGIQTDYETEQLSISVLTETLRLSVWGFPLSALCLSWVAALGTYVSPLSMRSGRVSAARFARHVEIVCLSTAAIFFVGWASDIHYWAYGLGYRSWVLICGLPFVALAVAESLQIEQSRLASGHETQALRRRSYPLMASVFFSVMVTQSGIWMSFLDRLSNEVSSSSDACVPDKSIEWLGGTPLDHWSITSLSVLLQGRSPRQIILTSDFCASIGESNGISIGDIGQISWDGGWFYFDRVQMGLAEGK